MLRVIFLVLLSQNRANIRFVNSASIEPTVSPTNEPSIFQIISIPSTEPTVSSSTEPTVLSSTEPTVPPTTEPTVSSSTEPTISPTIEPTVSSSTRPTISPTIEPSISTTESTFSPTIEHSISTSEPTSSPTVHLKCPFVSPIIQDGQICTGTVLTTVVGYVSKGDCENFCATAVYSSYKYDAINENCIIDFTTFYGTQQVATSAACDIFAAAAASAAQCEALTWTVATANPLPKTGTCTLFSGAISVTNRREGRIVEDMTVICEQFNCNTPEPSTAPTVHPNCPWAQPPEGYLCTGGTPIAIVDGLKSLDECENICVQSQYSSYNFVRGNVDGTGMCIIQFTSFTQTIPSVSSSACAALANSSSTADPCEAFNWMPDLNNNSTSGTANLGQCELLAAHVIGQDAVGGTATCKYMVCPPSAAPTRKPIVSNNICLNVMLADTFGDFPQAATLFAFESNGRYESYQASCDINPVYGDFCFDCNSAKVKDGDSVTMVVMGYKVEYWPEIFWQVYNPSNRSLHSGDFVTTMKYVLHKESSAHVSICSISFSPESENLLPNQQECAACMLNEGNGKGYGCVGDNGGDGAGALDARSPPEPPPKGPKDKLPKKSTASKSSTNAGPSKATASKSSTNAGPSKATASMSYSNEGSENTALPKYPTKEGPAYTGILSSGFGSGVAGYGNTFGLGAGMFGFGPYGNSGLIGGGPMVGTPSTVGFGAGEVRDTGGTPVSNSVGTVGVSGARGVGANVDARKDDALGAMKITGKGVAVPISMTSTSSSTSSSTEAGKDKLTGPMSVSVQWSTNSPRKLLGSNALNVHLDANFTWFLSDGLGAKYGLYSADGLTPYYLGTMCGSGGDDQTCEVDLLPGDYVYRVDGIFDPDAPKLLWEFCNVQGGSSTQISITLNDECDCQVTKIVDLDDICDDVEEVVDSSAAVAAPPAAAVVTLSGAFDLGGISHDQLSSEDVTAIRHAITKEFSDVSSNNDEGVLEVSKLSWSSAPDPTTVNEPSRRLLGDELSTVTRISFEVKVLGVSYGLTGTTSHALELLNGHMRTYLARSMSAGVFVVKLINVARSENSNILQSVSFAHLIHLNILHETKVNSRVSDVASVLVCIGTFVGVVFGVLLCNGHSRGRHNAYKHVSPKDIEELDA